jgi:hypothetical protein
MLARENPGSIPQLTRAKGNRGPGHTGVSYSAHGEPETCDPIGWINQFNEFDEQGIPFVPLIARPYSLHYLRKSTHGFAKHDHCRILQQMLRICEPASPF